MGGADGKGRCCIYYARQGDAEIVQQNISYVDDLVALFTSIFRCEK